jgi:GTP-binding protein Era
LKERKWEFNRADKSSLSREEFLCELTREQILHSFHEEIPYNVEIIIDYMRPGNKNSIKIYQTIKLNKSSYKPIILGKSGQSIKNLSQKTRVEMETYLKRKVHLFLRLKVSKK